MLQSVSLAVALVGFLCDLSMANPYLAKPGEKSMPVRIATCAVSGGFSHLYAALEYKLFAKYGFRVDHVFIRGSEPALNALAAGEIHFLYCAGETTLPAMAGGIDAKLVATTLVKPPHVLVTRKEVRRVEELQGKTLGIGRVGDLSDHLSRALVQQFNLADVKLRPIGGSQMERFPSLAADVVQAIVITPPLDLLAKKEGYAVIYRLENLDIPFVYSSLHATAKVIRKHPDAVQRLVAGFAESLRFAEQHPEKTQSAIGRVMRLKDAEALEATYNAYTRGIINRRLMVPERAVADAVDRVRRTSGAVRRRPEEIYDNRFAAHLESSGFMKLLWGSALSTR